VHKRLDSLVCAGKQFARTRRTQFPCDAKMVARIVVITCSEWITHTVMLGDQYTCARGCIVLLMLL
jgi:hypothetical protein